MAYAKGGFRRTVASGARTGLGGSAARLESICLSKRFRFSTVRLIHAATRTVRRYHRPHGVLISAIGHSSNCLCSA
jgi:hypothetical protein